MLAEDRSASSEGLFALSICRQEKSELDEQIEQAFPLATLS